MIHRDPYSTIHCVFNGTKDWLVIDRDQTDLIYMSDDSRYELGGYSIVDVDSVDLLEFPKIRDVRYSKVTMNKGDCIFMPGGKFVNCNRIVALFSVCCADICTSTIIMRGA